MVQGEAKVIDFRDVLVDRAGLDPHLQSAPGGQVALVEPFHVLDMGLEVLHRGIGCPQGGPQIAGEEDPILERTDRDRAGDRKKSPNANHQTVEDDLLDIGQDHDQAL